MEDNLVRLEEKVLRAVRVIQELRSENDRLQLQRTQLEVEFNALRERSERLGRELDEVRTSAASVESFEEQRRILEEKVGGLLEKLDQIG